MNVTEQAQHRPPSNVRESLYRDGNRIASRGFGGFVDTVPSERIAEYAADPTSSPADRAFAAAVLAFRAWEDALAATDPRSIPMASR
jgi:hypothetical protein